MGTPTMGGGLILISILISTLLWADLSNTYIWLMIFVTTSFGAIGLVDDYSKIKHKNSDGMSALTKYFLQSIVAIVVALYLFLNANTSQETLCWFHLLKI
jgi:phospho-N-acetylmuramoyl-pentapeptide-transferase